MKKMMPMMMVMMLLVIAAGVFAVQGVSMHNQVAEEEEAFHALNDDYFSIAKQERDSAVTGSALNENLVEIANFPSELLRLKLVGVGKILTGIFVLLFGILIALIMMPTRLAATIKENEQS